MIGCVKFPCGQRDRRSPLHRGGFRRVVVGIFAVLDTPEEIDDERNLRQSRSTLPTRLAGSTGIQSVPNRVIASDAVLATIVPTPMHPEHRLEILAADLALLQLRMVDPRTDEKRLPMRGSMGFQRLT